jgi:hypothetical protein
MAAVQVSHKLWISAYVQLLRLLNTCMCLGTAVFHDHLCVSGNVATAVVASSRLRVCMFLVTRIQWFVLQGGA